MLERDGVYRLEWLRKTWNVESPSSFVWNSGVRDQGRGVLYSRDKSGLSIMFGRSKSEDCRFSAKESCYDSCLLVRFSVDATAVAPPPLPPPALTALAVAQAKHSSVSPASRISGLDMGLRPPASKSPAPLTPPGSPCNLLLGGMAPASTKTCEEAFIRKGLFL